MSRPKGPIDDAGEAPPGGARAAEMGDDPIAHLGYHRRLILGHSLWAGAASLVPLPIVDELAAGAVRARLLGRLTTLHGIEVDPAALRVLAAAPSADWLRAASLSAAVFTRVRGRARRLAASLFVLGRLDEAISTYQVGTLYDHYCARHHGALRLDLERAARLQAAMTAAARRARGEALGQLAGQLFRGSLAAAAALRQGAARVIQLARPRVDRPASPAFDEGAPLAGLPAALRSFAHEATGLERGYLTRLVHAFDAGWPPQGEGEDQGEGEGEGKAGAS